MKKVVSFVLLALFVGCLAFAVNVKPFGIEFGQSAESQVNNGLTIISGPITVAPGIDAYIVSPPKAHSQLDTYYLYQSKKYGIIKVIALKDVTTTAYGTAVKNLFEKIRDGLDSAYGKGEHIDFLKYNSIWKDAGDWMYALKNEDRVLASYWTVQADDGEYGIYMQASAKYSTEGEVKLVYESPDFEKARTESEEDDNSVF